MIKLLPKRSFNNWVDMGDGVKFLLDYPTRQQQQELDELFMMVGTEEDDAKKNAIMLRYIKRIIKYTVKDWKGLDVECKLIKNELEDDLWCSLTSDIEQTTKIWVKINSELEYTEDDKKKRSGSGK